MTFIVFGPPGAGKTSYVREHLSPGDAVIDFDWLYTAISGQPHHRNESNLWELVSSVRGYLEQEARKHRPEVRHWWIVRSTMSEQDVEMWESMKAQIVVIDPGKGEVMHRIMNDKSRKHPEKWVPIVEDWYQKHRTILGKLRGYGG